MNSDRLLPNTKLRKNKIQLILIRDLSRDRSEVMQALPDIEREEVAGHFFWRPRCTSARHGLVSAMHQNGAHWLQWWILGIEIAMYRFCNQRIF
jgi:hypothetical protein